VILFFMFLLFGSLLGWLHLLRLPLRHCYSYVRDFGISLVFMCLDHVGGFIEHANHNIMRSTAKLRAFDCMAGCIRPGVPEATEWQRI